jgi:hypothetical protein
MLDALTTGEFSLSPLRREPCHDAIAMVALNFHGAVLCGAARSQQAFEGLRDLIDLARLQPGHDAHRSGAPSLASDAHHAVLGNASSH